MYSCGGGSASRAFDKSLNEICRVCFSRKCAVLNVFETTLMNQTTIADMFMLFLGEYMYPDDDLPHFICCDCIEEVIETGNVSKECKDAVSYVVWRARVLKMVSPTIRPATENIISDGCEVKRKDSTGCKNYPVLYSAYENKSFCLSTKSVDKSNYGISYEASCPELNVCSHCGGIFLNAEDLSDHVMRIHGEAKGYHCGKCYRIFKTMKSFEKHIENYNFNCASSVRKRSEANIKSSSISTKSISSSVVTVNESFQKEKILKYSCVKCGFSNETRRALVNHLRELHSSNKPFVCKICGLGFIGRRDFELHRNIHPKDYKCVKCNREFFSSLYYKAHVMFCQLGIVDHKCWICGLGISSKGNLRHHMETHSSLENYECEKCGKRFRLRNSFLRHFRVVHLKVKPHQCEICMKRFSFKDNLYLHYINHSELRPYVCSICNKTFKDQRYLNEHRKKVHKIFKPKRENIIVNEELLANIPSY